MPYPDTYLAAKSNSDRLMPKTDSQNGDSRLAKQVQGVPDVLQSSVAALLGRKQAYLWVIWTAWSRRQYHTIHIGQDIIPELIPDPSTARHIN